MAADRIILGGAPEGFDAHLLARELARGAPVVHVARDDKRAEAMRVALSVMAPDTVVIDLPAWDCLPYDRMSPNPAISARRMATLAALAQGAVPGNFVLLTTLSAAMQRVPARAVLREAAFSARVGDRTDVEALKGFLVRMGFSPVSTVAEPGDYAIRGGIIDLWPPGQRGPVRLDFFGDVLDGARRFDAETQRTVEKLGAIEFAPMSEVILDPASITRFRQNYRAEFGAGGSDDPLYEAVSAGRKHQGMEHWLPFFHDRLETVFDYLPHASVMLDDAVTPARLARWESIADQYDARREAMTARGRLDTVYKPVEPGLLYLDDAAWEAVAGHRVVQLSPLPQSPGPGVLDAGGRMGRNFAPERQQEKISLFGALADHVQALREVGQVVIASWSDGARERLQGLLADNDVRGAETVRDFRAVPEGKGGLFLMVWSLEAGFVAPGLALISEQDVLGDRLVAKPKKRRKAENFLREVDTLTPGDLVVHVEHGVGRYLGLETITALGAPHACVALEYAENAKLYLPVENIELLSRYGHEEGLLDRDCRPSDADCCGAGLAQRPGVRSAAFDLGGVCGAIPLSGNR
jgi:transcription-repair coupling factor (superfamily II helicase)